MLKETAMNKDQLGQFLSSSEAKNNEFRAVLNEDIKNNTIHDKNLLDLLEYGIGIHHAGMNRSDRGVVEDYFNNGYLQVIVSTATLAWGVNLPAHTVIIKGTQVYDPEKGGWTELSHLDVLQMMGRAGRYGYGPSIGEGIIITSHYELQYYLSLLNQQLPIESQMISALPDAINAEVVLGTISNLKDAVNWLAYSYLYIRMMKAGQVYSIDPSVDDPYLLQRRTHLAHSAANLLDKYGLIKYDRKTGIFQATQMGKVASHFYIKYQSMEVYNKYLSPTISMIDLFRLFSLSNEFKQIPIREEEKKEIEKLMLKVPIPIKGSIEEPASKVSILLQSYISQYKLEGYAIASDMIYISQSAGRIFRALFEICLKRAWANVALMCLNLCKMIQRRMWSTMTPLRQFKIIPEDILYKIERKEQLTWDRFYDLIPQQIFDLIKVNKRHAEGIYQLVKTFPKLELQASIQTLTRSCILVELIITPDFKWNEEIHGSSETFYIIVEDNDSEIILHYEVFILKQKFINEDHRINFIVPMMEPMPPQYFIRVVSERWINSEKLLAISFKHTILPEKFPPHIGLLDMQPLLFSSLKFPEAEEIYSKLFGFEQMLPIQTQTFKALYETNDSVLIAAPTGSGKSLCGEFAILKYLKDSKTIYKGQNRAPVIFVSSIEALVKDKFKYFSEVFGKETNYSLGLNIGYLTGQISIDNKIIDNSHIVLTTPDKLDILTRHWRQKSNVQEISLISLIIIDEIHLIGESGSILEIVLSRLKYMSYQLDKEIRFVALGTSLANPNNLAEWLGISFKNIFNFGPNVRPNKLEIFFQSFDHIHRKMRLIAMSKPLYNCIKTHGYSGATKHPIMIFVSDKKHARITAFDLLTYAATDDDPKKFLISGTILDDLIHEISDETLIHLLKFGIGYIHDGLNMKEKEIVIQLYLEKIIQILIMTHSVCWEFNLFCHLVIILDPVRFDGKEHSWVDYSIPDILQIMGRASTSGGSYNPNVTRKCLLLCQTSKKEFYKKFMNESFPVESHLNHFLHDHFNAEITGKTIQNKQECLDWLTWTYMYRRLLQNPNYYDMKGKSNVYLNDYLSELVENTLIDLQKANCITIENDVIRPINFGKIASFYYVKYNTIDLLSQSLKEESSKIRDLLEILRSAYEFENIPVRKGDEEFLEMIYQDKDTVRFKLNEQEIYYNDPHVKSFILLQCYFGRKPIPGNLLTTKKR